MDSLKFTWNVPNVLSLLRLLLLPVFVALYLNSQAHPSLLYWSLAVLVLSGLTDLLDGYIARRFHQVTEIGKLLDPVADKLTQIVVLLCLAARYPALTPVVVICLVKEVLQAIGGWILLSRLEIIRGSKWFGKISTFTFYAAMLLIVLWDDMPNAVLWGLIALVSVTMLFSFFSYLAVFFRLRRENASHDTKPSSM